MSSGTGENEAGLRKILDFTRLGAILVLLLHCYFYCYGAFERWGLTSLWGDQFLQNIALTGLYSTVWKSKLISLGLLGISLLGARGKKSENINLRSILVYLVLGLGMYFASVLILGFRGPVEQLATGYMTLTGTGFLLILAGGNLLSRYIRVNLGKDIFNELNETFPQEERLLENEYSINLPAQYNLRGKVRKSWINIINPFRGLLVCGSPGAGKSYFVIQHIIRQHIRKGFTMLVYDFKYDDLT